MTEMLSTDDHLKDLTILFNNSTQDMLYYFVSLMQHDNHRSQCEEKNHHLSQVCTIDATKHKISAP